MELAFSSKHLRKVCEYSDVAEAELGAISAVRLANRLSDLRTIDHVDGLPAGRPRMATIQGSECYVIDLADSYKMVITPNHTKAPKNADGSIDWLSVSRVMVMEITQNYD